MLEGQWVGSTAGTNIGFLILNVEKRFWPKARLVFVDQNAQNVHFYATVTLSLNENKLVGTLTDFLAFDHEHQELNTWEILCNKYAYVPEACPKAGTLSATLLPASNIDEKADSIEGSWACDIGTKGSFSLSRNRKQKTKRSAISMSWNEYKDWISKQAAKFYIYRGQKDATHNLRTLFYRTGRSDLISYDKDDVPMLRHFINAESRYSYSTDSEDYGGLLNLAQHHGYPTPLLDWTESPFVGAYFAYEDVRNSEDEGNVRIFQFDVTRWTAYPKNIAPEVSNVLDPRPTITIRRLPAHNNRRAMPQQSISMFSNIEDIEFFIWFISHYAKDSSQQPDCLQIVELPRAERKNVMADLRLMGITAGSLFPGFDGICRALREQNF